MSAPLRGGAGVLLLAVVAALGWWSHLTTGSLLGDEGPYLCAALKVVEGGSPRDCVGFLYADGVARALAVAVSVAGPTAALALSRGAVWLGAATTVWLSLRLTGWSWAVRASIGALAVLFWSPVAQSLSLGNLSAATAGLAVLALALRQRKPYVAGILLGVAITLKPLPAGVPLVLLGHALGNYRRGRGLVWPDLICGLTALGVAGLLALYGGGFAPPPPFSAVAQNPITLVRVFHQFGVTVSPLSCFGVVVAMGTILAGLRGFDAPLVDALAVTTSLLAAPLVWNHSFVLVTPVLALALGRATHAYRSSAGDKERRQWAVLAVLGSVAAASFVTASDAFGVVGHGDARGALLLLPPLLAPGALVAYLRLERSAGGGQP